MKCLSTNGKSIRSLNLSYNDLDFNQNDNAGSNYQYSLKFMEYLPIFLEKAKFINHINFSGMQYQKTQIKELTLML